MPELAFFVFLVDFEVFELRYLILELYDEPDLGGGAEVANYQEANNL